MYHIWRENNLYRWAMSQYLPVDGFKWLTQIEINGLDVNAIRNDNAKGSIRYWSLVSKRVIRFA